MKAAQRGVNRLWTQNTEINRVTIVGTGLIGGSWAACFLAHGLDVVATDPAPEHERQSAPYVEAAWPALTKIGLAPGAWTSVGPNLLQRPEIPGDTSSPGQPTTADGRVGGSFDRKDWSTRPFGPLSMAASPTPDVLGHLLFVLGSGNHAGHCRMIENPSKGEVSHAHSFGKDPPDFLNGLKRRFEIDT